VLPAFSADRQVTVVVHSPSKAAVATDAFLDKNWLPLPPQDVRQGALARDASRVLTAC
jgi:hypothetical protein